MIRKPSPLAFAVALALAAPVAHAQETSRSDAQPLDTLIVTGTRVADRTVAESTAPIDIITPEVLESTGTVELATALSRAVPSLNFPRAAINDGTDAMRPAQLRGLAPDHTLVLVKPGYWSQPVGWITLVLLFCGTGSAVLLLAGRTGRRPVGIQKAPASQSVAGAVERAETRY